MESEHIHHDAGLDAMLGRFQLEEPEGFQCANSLKIDRVCINPGCQTPSLICNSFDCPKCKGKEG